MVPYRENGFRRRPREGLVLSSLRWPDALTDRDAPGEDKLKAKQSLCETTCFKSRSTTPPSGEMEEGSMLCQAQEHQTSRAVWGMVCT